MGKKDSSIKKKQKQLKKNLRRRAEASAEADAKLDAAREKSPKKNRKDKIAKHKIDPKSLVLPGQTYDFSYTQNREVSWLRFDDRVLDEAVSPNTPLLERLSFCSIFGSNLDEWFMVRIGGLSDLATLKHQPRDNRSAMTPSEQIDTVLGVLPVLLDKCDNTYLELDEAMKGYGVVRVTPSELSDSDRTALAHFSHTRVQPIASPLIVDPRHPFPNLRNNTTYVMCSLDGPDEQGVLGMVEVPPMLPRIVELPCNEGWRYILVEDAMRATLDGMFGAYHPTESAVVRVTRNADVDPDGEGVQEEEDYRQHMKKVLRRRLRLQPVRMEIEGQLPWELEEFVREELCLTPNRVFRRSIPLDLSYVYSLGSHVDPTAREQLSYPAFEPQRSPMAEAGVPMRQQVEDHDILLWYPYESMAPLLELIQQAAWDDACISIKITLYRVAKQSRLCESLIAAAENGKDVTVLMELRARFDEQNNIEWAERLESAGCTVIYGSEGFKCHSKICLITYHDANGISRITCLGTGNFNEKTARLYSDFMLLTSHEGIGEDGNAFFRNLSLGDLSGTYKYLGVAPVGLKPLIMRGIDREIAKAKAGEPAHVFMKMNSLTDRDVIDKIAEASQAGVDIQMIIRGIACMRPGVEGKTEGIEVHQIVGRFLEHARVYAFGVEADTVYLSSADMMTRNTEHRVEIAYPVLDATCRALVVEYMECQLADNTQARELTRKGTWKPIAVAEGDRLVNSQNEFIDRAWRAANGMATEPLPEPPDFASRNNDDSKDTEDTEDAGETEAEGSEFVSLVEPGVEDAKVETESGAAVEAMDEPQPEVEASDEPQPAIEEAVIPKDEPSSSENENATPETKAEPWLYPTKPLVPESPAEPLVEPEASAKEREDAEEEDAESEESTQEETIVAEPEEPVKEDLGPKEPVKEDPEPEESEAEEASTLNLEDDRGQADDEQSASFSFVPESAPAQHKAKKKHTAPEFNFVPEAEHVEAHLIEPEEGSEGESSEQTALVKRTPNRFMAGMRLIGLGFRTLVFGGKKRKKG